MLYFLLLENRNDELRCFQIGNCSKYWQIPNYTPPAISLFLPSFLQTSIFFHSTAWLHPKPSRPCGNNNIITKYTIKNISFHLDGRMVWRGSQLEWGDYLLK